MVVDNKIVGERMEFLRENMGVSQKNLAEYLDISQPYLSQIAAGKRPMSLTILDKLCALFGCSEQYLWVWMIAFIQSLMHFVVKRLMLRI